MTFGINPPPYSQKETTFQPADCPEKNTQSQPHFSPPLPSPTGPRAVIKMHRLPAITPDSSWCRDERGSGLHCMPTARKNPKPGKEGGAGGTERAINDRRSSLSLSSTCSTASSSGSKGKSHQAGKKARSLQR